MVDEIEPYPYLNAFPGMRGIIEGSLIARQDLDTAFAAAGFDRVAHQVATDWNAYADNLTLKAGSFVARLPEEGIAPGLATLRAKAMTNPDASICINMGLIISRQG